MTTKPKAKKFRIRRTGGLGAAARAEEPMQDPVEAPTAVTPAAPMQSNAAKNEAPQPPISTPAQGEVATASDVNSEAEIDAIRREGLTGRQLRMARRVAQKHGLAPTSDFDAVRLLRAKGIDPFQRSNMLQLVVPNDGESKNDTGETPVQLPQTVPSGDGMLPATDLLAGANERASEIMKIQRDIAKRRRRKIVLLISRLSFFIFLPTLLAAYYFYIIATPLYATNSEFIIQQAESANAGSLGSMFGSSQLATVQDSIAVQGYLTSREAMQRLDEDFGFKAHFARDEIDAIQRLDPDATDEQAYKLFKRNVKIGYDPTEGIVKMEVIAADPETSEQWARTLISYAEERVDSITQRVREDQMKGARESFEEALAERDAALDRLVEIQRTIETIDPLSEVATINGQIGQRETELQEKELQLQALLDNARPNAARVEGVRADIRRLQALIDSLRTRLTVASTDGVSLADKNAELRRAEIDLQTRDGLLQGALQQMETARIEANRQVRYLSLGVTPTAPDEAVYPRKFENTVLAFIILSGIYLMVSLTASILREQVTS
ncbi:MAG: capsule biosynthesis protein [Pseudomonadota bacterium]